MQIVLRCTTGDGTSDLITCHWPVTLSIKLEIVIIETNSGDTLSTQSSTSVGKRQHIISIFARELVSPEKVYI
ncbi:unnamed protein product [Leptosia nina]|uniref:Uncharacterized protein n=1 Tax=Leptosia nina TaxID=320188 RepID=A0AAV1JA07_9NEOP